MDNQEVSWSAFLREPTIVEPLLKRGDVVLKRRDGEPLRLSLEANDDSQHEALAAVARLLSQLVSKQVRASAEKEADAQLPWTRFLPMAERRTFIAELLRQFEACADLGDFSALGRFFAEWKNTATLHADGLAHELKRPIKSIGATVPRPRR